MSKKPPLGLVPRNIHDESRIDDIWEAMTRYYEDFKEIPLEWVEEYNELSDQRGNPRPKYKIPEEVQVILGRHEGEEWILVKDRMPEQGDLIIALDKDGGEHTGYHYSSHPIILDNIIAWKPKVNDKD